MAVKKLSISLDADVAEKAARAAEREGISLSAWLGNAAAEAIEESAGRAALAEYVETYGAPSEEQMAAAERRLDGVGVGRVETEEEARRRRAALALLTGNRTSDAGEAAG